jgi:peptidoglycan/LPS O-acetylase OafA/YrhL
MGPVAFWEPLIKTALYAVISTLLVGAVVLGAHGRFERLLRSRLMVWLGGISYEIFLLHVLVMGLLLGVVLRWPLFTGSLTGLYVATLLTTIPLAVLLRRITDARLDGRPDDSAKFRLQWNRN